MSYRERKNYWRQAAIDWQDWAATVFMSYDEIGYWMELFEKQGRRYGLLTEFRENGIC